MTRRLTPDELQALLGAYAVDALAPWEAQQVEEHLAANQEARAEVEEHRQVLADLAVAVAGDAPPPPHLWDGIEAGLASAPPPLRLVATDTAPRRARRVAPWIASFAAAAAVVLVALFGVQALSRDDPSIERAAQSAVTAPGSEVVVLEGAGVEVRVALQDDGVGYVLESGLPALAADRTYQLWAIVGDEVISAGVLGADPGVAPFQVTGTLAGLALTDEVAGGVAVSANQPVAVWLREG